VHPAAFFFRGRDLEEVLPFLLLLGLFDPSSIPFRFLFRRAGETFSWD